MKGFQDRFSDLPDYILKITKEIWEERGLRTLDHYYARDIIMRFPSGIVRGNDGVIDGTLATLAEMDGQIDIERGPRNGRVNTHGEAADERVRNTRGVERAYRIDQGRQFVRFRLHARIPAAMERYQAPLPRRERRH